MPVSVLQFRCSHEALIIVIFSLFSLYFIYSNSSLLRVILLHLHIIFLKSRPIFYLSVYNVDMKTSKIIFMSRIHQTELCFPTILLTDFVVC